MNARLSLYLSGGALLSRTLYLKGGRRVAIIDRTKRWKAAARAMRLCGMRDYEISIALPCTRERLEKVLSFDWRF